MGAYPQTIGPVLSTPACYPADPVSRRPRRLPAEGVLLFCPQHSQLLFCSQHSQDLSLLRLPISHLHSQHDPFLTLKGERLQRWTPYLAKETLPALPTGPQEGQKEAACLHLHSGCIYSQRKGTGKINISSDQYPDP